MAQTRRVFKVAEKVRELLAFEIIGRAEPRFAMFTITSVVVSPDLRMAKIYWSVPPDFEYSREEVVEALEEHTMSLRKSLARKLSVRAVPELRFYFDETMDRVEEVERLFARVAAEDAARGSSGSDVDSDVATDDQEADLHNSALGEQKKVRDE